MARFRMYTLRTNNILQLYEWKDQIDLDPPYQRLSIWDPQKRQRFIDSVINGFDIPKLYFHQLSPTSGQTNKYKYAVIDGKQRILALWEFKSNRLPLAEDFVFFEDETIHAAGAKYEELMAKYPRLRARFDSFDVPITVVQTDDTNFIEVGATTGVYTIKILPGEFALFRHAKDETVTVLALADTGNVDVEYFIFED